MAGSPGDRAGDWAAALGGAVRAAALAARAALPGLAGLAAASYGAWLAYEPAGWITAGVLLLADRVMTARAAGQGAGDDG